MGLAARYAALGSALDSTEELWHPSPKGVIRTAACQAAPTAGCEGGCYRGSFACVFGSRSKSPIRSQTNSEL